MRKLLIILILISISFIPNQATSLKNHVFDCIVAQDGTGNYTTIQDAIDQAPENSKYPYLIFIKAGHYHEHIYIPANKPMLHLIGQGQELVRISDDRVSGGPNASPVDVAATVVSNGTDEYFEGITFENSWGTQHNDGPQALALYTKEDRNIVNKCKMLSFQDTYRTANGLNGRNYVRNCFIQGGIDFLYGQGNVFFDHCTLNIVKKDGGWIVAPKHMPGTTWGYVLKNTTITAPGNPKGTRVWLGRPWLHSPMAVFIDTQSKVTIPDSGWYDHMASIPRIYADYNTMDAHNKPLDLSHRISMYYMITEKGDTIWGKAKNHLTKFEASQYTIKNVLGGYDHWDPEIICKQLPAVKYRLKEEHLFWKEVNQARGYIIYQDNKMFSTSTLTGIIVPRGHQYSVKAVSNYGTIGL